MAQSPLTAHSPHVDDVASKHFGVSPPQHWEPHRVVPPEQLQVPVPVQTCVPGQALFPHVPLAEHFWRVVPLHCRASGWQSTHPPRLDSQALAQVVVGARQLPSPSHFPAGEYVFPEHDAEVGGQLRLVSG